jgi:phthiocerol/phenolphthiocerol synthesis type-I polyketide synthase E
MEKENIPNQPNDFDIAVIGMAGRFPGAKNIDELWQALCSGRELVSFFSEDELRESGIDSKTYNDPNYVKAGAILDNPDMFDAKFFKYAPREAAIIDPQQRLFLECAWEALEDAGYDTERYQGSIGVYAGATRSTYVLNNELVDGFASRDLATIMGNDSNFITTRVSYKLNLKGPSVAVQTACSTSLVAIHMACQSLLNQECDMALAGGVCIRFPQKAGYIYQPGNIPSSDGHCRAFDEKADGTIFGSGAGVVMLKRLADAVRDGDNIHAVVKGSAMNNDGHLKVDYTAPSVEGQSQVIVEALANAGVEADSISFIEAHGTGTALGDPIEVAALTKAFRNYTDRNGFCAIGSVKTNIGHLDIAAGVASFIKTVMSLKHKKIPPTLHFRKANPEIDFKNSPFHVNNQLMDWETPHPRRAGVSSFGIGGTNAHVILEEAPVVKDTGKSRPGQLLLLSAKTDTALETATTNLVEHLKSHRDINLADVAYTLQTGRQAFNQRRMLVCQDTEDAIKTLSESDNKRVISASSDETQRDVVFVFSGQGSQYVNMGLDLYRNEPVFREEMDRCFEIWRSQLNIELRDIIYPGDPVTEEASKKITQTGYSRPALFTIEYALAKLWMSWGVKPSAMVGHGIGEYTAACLAGVFSLEDALRVVATGGRLIQETPEGSMLAVFLSEKELQPLMNEKLSIAVINLPSLCVISGEKQAIADLEKQLSGKKVICRNVRTSHAFHSRMMDPVVSVLAEQVKQVRLNKPQIPFMSNTSGTWITPDEATNPEYWARHLRQTVRFSDCAGELLKETNRVFLEVGPGETFSSLVKQHPALTKEHVVLASTPHPKEETIGETYILNTIGQLWLANAPVDRTGFYANEERHRLPLPTYPFERQRYWIGYSGKKRETAPAEDASLKETRELTKSSTEPESVYGDGNNKEIEKTLAALWQDILGVKKVNNTDNFFDLGGTSLMAVNLFSEIEKIYDKRLPLAILMKAPNIKQLAAVIQDEKPTTAWNSLIEIKAGNARPPLFFIHAAGGNLLIYRDLVRYLGPEQPVYGLQAQGLDGKQPILDRIEDMAAQYIREIQAIYPNGPYLLAGYCMGGSVAYEMAQQLRAQGQEIALLALMETYDFSNQPRAVLDRIQYRIQQIEFHLRNLLLTDQKMVFLKEKIKVAWSRKDIVLGTISGKLGLGPKTGNGRYVLLSNVWAACDLAAWNYVPKTYPGRITLFRPKKEYACFSGPELALDKFASSKLVTHVLPVYPRGMLVEPFVGLLADKLKECIRKVQERLPEGSVNL